MIKVTDKYFIDYDGGTPTVVKRTWSENKSCWKYAPVCYPSTLKAALSKIMRLVNADEMKDQEINLNEALSIMDRNYKKFERLLTEHVKE